MTLSTAIHTKLPDLAKSFAKMKLVDDLLFNTKADTKIGRNIITAILDKKPSNQVICEVKDQVQADPLRMSGIIGEDLVKRIQLW